MALHIAYPFVIYIVMPVIVLMAYWRWYYYKKPTYTYSSVDLLEKSGTRVISWYYPLLWLLRLVGLTSLCVALMRPQVPDENSKVPVEGVPMILVIDASDSMGCYDDLYDQRTRFEVARSQAQAFIEKRVHDPIGLVFFACNAISAAPLTLDKQVLAQILQDTHLGTINSHDTRLGKAIVTAAHKLKDAPGQQRVMIILTDGQPSSQDIPIDTALAIAKKWGIKIYAIGIGSKEGGFIRDPLFGLCRTQSTLNEELLHYIAQETGGAFFLAQKPKDIERIYSDIDALERSEYKMPLFSRYFEYFMPCLYIAGLCVATEIGITSLWWLGL